MHTIILATLGSLPSFLVLALFLFLGACSTIGKAPVYRAPVVTYVEPYRSNVVAIDTQQQVITVVEPITYGYRAADCRAHGNTYADGFYGCSEARNHQ